MDPEKHYPTDAEPETPAEEQPAPEAEPKPDGEGEPKPGDEQTPEAKPEEKPDEKPEPPLKKPRSIYDDYKDKKEEAKTEKERADAAEAKAAELQALLDAKGEAVTPKEKSEAAADLAEYAKKHEVPVEQLEELQTIFLSKVPKAEMPDGMTKEELADWRASRAQAKQAAEDSQILATAPTVKTQLNIQDDAELATVMKEVVKLAHTPEFHDKEVEYIVWKKQAELSKLVSPKKPSFEQGGQQGDAPADGEPDFSATTGITPTMATKAQGKRGNTLEVRRGNKVL